MYEKVSSPNTFSSKSNSFFYVRDLHNQGLIFKQRGTSEWVTGIATSDSVLLYRVRQKEAEEEERSREYMEDRMQAILSLKGNIETNKVQ